MNSLHSQNISYFPECILEGTTVTFSIPGADCDWDIEDENGNNVYSESDENSITYTFNNTGTYFVEATAIFGPFSILLDDIEIFVGLEGPFVDLQNDTLVCSDVNFNLSNLIDSLHPANPNMLSFEWETNSNTFNGYNSQGFAIDPIDNYISLIITDISGCTYEDNASIFYIPSNHNSEFTYTPTGVLCAGSPLSFIADSINPSVYDYVW